MKINNEIPNILTLSDKQRRLGRFFKFHFTKVGKWITILFKRRKKLEKLSLEYYKSWRFDNAYLVIDFKFKSAVWFSIGNIKGTDFTKPIILNLQNIKSDTLNLEVFGFFQRQVYKINLNREAKINTQTFKTKIDNINTVELVEQKTKTTIPIIALQIDKPILSFEKISITHKNVNFNYKPFKIQDYI